MFQSIRFEHFTKAGPFVLHSAFIILRSSLLRHLRQHFVVGVGVQIRLGEEEGEADGGAGPKVLVVLGQRYVSLLSLASERADGRMNPIDRPAGLRVEIDALAGLIDGVGVPVSLGHGVPAGVDPGFHVERDAAFAGEGFGHVGEVGFGGGVAESIDVNFVDGGSGVFGVVALVRIFDIGEIEIGVVFGAEINCELGVGLDERRSCIDGGLFAVLGDAARAAPEADLEAGGSPTIGPAVVEGVGVVGAGFSGVVDLQRDPGGVGEVHLGSEAVGGEGGGAVDEHAGGVEEGVGWGTGGVGGIVGGKSEVHEHEHDNHHRSAASIFGYYHLVGRC